MFRSLKSANNPAMPYHFALATPETTIVKALTLAGHSAIWILCASKAALNLVRLKMLG